MTDALVVIEDEEQDSDILQRAGTLTAGVDGTLYLVSTVTEDELQDTVSTLQVIGQVEQTAYGDETAIKAMEQQLSEFASEELEDVAVDYETSVVVCPADERVEAVCEAATDYDCDHIYTSGLRRTPTGKAVFGDFVQQLMLQFDGYVTADLVQ
jgi:nucleotide-binding universal stress UspA family protein